jgi:hypothetical protein
MTGGRNNYLQDLKRGLEPEAPMRLAAFLLEGGDQTSQRLN